MDGDARTGRGTPLGKRSSRQPLTRLLIAPLLSALSGCGDYVTPGHPNGPVHLQETKTGDVGAHTWTCAVELYALEGVFRAQVTPSALYMELRTGPCSTAGDVLASSSVGTMTLSLQSHGSYHVEVGNPTDSVARYTLDVDYYAPSI